MKTEVIEINVEGDVGSGKTHVLAVIEKALKAEYGHSVQVVSRVLTIERNLLGDDSNMTKPNLDNVVFVLRESGVVKSVRRDSTHEC